MQMQNEFTQYVSNTFVGTANNYILQWGQPKKITGRIFYKVSEYGEFDYKFFFSNTVDGTFDDGKVARANVLGGKWDILSASVGDGGKNPKRFHSEALIPVLFDHSPQRTVLPGEQFWSDVVKVSIPKDHYLVFQWTVVGDNIPFTPDKLMPSFVEQKHKFKQSPDFPQPHLVACNRDVKKRIAFLGDSITQGIGTRNDCYEFWVAEIGKRLGNEYSVWNLGLGFGRAQDAASEGVWFNKAAQMDLVSVCFGENDIQQGRTTKQICDDLLQIVLSLKRAGCDVGIFTVPPFDWKGENEKTWRAVNAYITNELSAHTIFVFDTVPIWGSGPRRDGHPKYGLHPNGRGCKNLAKRFVEVINVSGTK